MDQSRLEQLENAILLLQTRCANLESKVESIEGTQVVSVDLYTTPDDKEIAIMPRVIYRTGNGMAGKMVRISKSEVSDKIIRGMLKIVQKLANIDQQYMDSKLKDELNGIMEEIRSLSTE